MGHCKSMISKNKNHLSPKDLQPKHSRNSNKPNAYGIYIKTNKGKLEIDNKGVTWEENEETNSTEIEEQVEELPQMQQPLQLNPTEDGKWVDQNGMIYTEISPGYYQDQFGNIKTLTM